jgi:hypothetical protein
MEVEFRVKKIRKFCNTTHIIQFNSVQFFIIYGPSQQPQGQLQTQHSLDKSNYFMDKHNIKLKTN